MKLDTATALHSRETMSPPAPSRATKQKGTASVILAVDDEPLILRLLKRVLSDQDFTLITASDGGEALKLLDRHRPDAAILDVVMPGMTGLELMKEIHRSHPIPIMLLTARGSDDDVVRGLELGADDYVAKPFNPTELAARVRALVWRNSRSAHGREVVSVGDLEIDFPRRTLSKRGEAVKLARIDWLIFRHLAVSAGSLVESSDLITRVWGPESGGGAPNLRVRIARLRTLIEDDPANPRYIKTFSGRGYLLDCSDF